MTAAHEYFITAPPGCGDLVQGEALAAGMTEAREAAGGVRCHGMLEAGYRLCLWSRVASRVLLKLGTFPAANPDELYAGVRAIDWLEHVAPDGSIACEFASAVSQMTHSQYGALKTKDAIVDFIRDRTGRRPDVDTRQPDLRVNVYVYRDVATCSIDLSGEALHRRGYRAATGAAPLKENLAAGILLRSGWADIAKLGGAFVDPLCGSGTFAIEAALIAHDRAPGLTRESFGFLRWKGHDAALWAGLLESARQRVRDSAAKNRIVGYDHDRDAISAAIAGIEGAGLSALVHVERRELAELENPGEPTGLVAVNPPYGERIGADEGLERLYETLGAKLREQFKGWWAAVLTGNPTLGQRMGIAARRTHTVWNGTIECKLLRFDITDKWFRDISAEARAERVAAHAASPGAAMFANRIQKNQKALGSWLKETGISCYRLYDADMPEYAFAIDIYKSGPDRWVCVQEYEAPDSIAQEGVRQRRSEALAALPSAIGIAPEFVVYRRRRKQKEGDQYERIDEREQLHEVEEAGLRFLVNFFDYLDTGIFLDHRPTRALIREMSKGKRFLNLFAYTASATVFAAAGGATRTTTVDMSNSYLDWAEANLKLNGFTGEAHEVVRADCLEWLVHPWPRRNDRLYDLAFIDPPTFSRSKKMKGHFGVQRDHVDLIVNTAKLLAPGGAILFANNFTRFKLDRESLSGFAIEDLTAQTVPRDFQRNPRIHSCFLLRPA
ncbi:MAG TPA: bifunctional 23S rRNA (guanine(2069)-N(7))-methyltransferase RlmK/23S rRNA (guanine(2445)-N(2))-methyltransferase RlmL [Steroidobacteraceae bacterium]|nr:bifunctional 23S rRNA (guanine(2069)-N(7))-methyltransferase RlmK/23S rRNA (guanine(2445)-N(2))-methyltransferase RlmL [Steroidobacteraceae bacterium]